jgi:hypothetical protein
VGQSVAIGDKHFEVVKEFVYLWSLMIPTNDVSVEIQQRIKTANRCFFGLRKHLQSSHLSRQTKFTIHKTLIRPALLYGSETWVLTKREENQLLVFERKVLRTICGPKMVSTGEGTTTNLIKIKLVFQMSLKKIIYNLKKWGNSIRWWSNLSNTVRSNLSCFGKISWAPMTLYPNFTGGNSWIYDLKIVLWEKTI